MKRFIAMLLALSMVMAMTVCAFGAASAEDDVKSIIAQAQDMTLEELAKKAIEESNGKKFYGVGNSSRGKSAHAIEHAKANVVHDAVEVIRHHETAGYFNIRAEDLEQGSGEHVVGVELACVGKAVCGYFHRGSPHSLMHSVAHSIAHSRAADNKKEPPHDAATPVFYRKFSQWLACAASNSACVRI